MFIDIIGEIATFPSIARKDLEDFKASLFSVDQQVEVMRGAVPMPMPRVGVGEIDCFNGVERENLQSPHV